MIMIPDEVRREVFAVAYEEADKANYLSSNRVQNKCLIMKLVKMNTVGRRLLDYIPQESLQKYIKDTILNRYSKDRLKQQSPSVEGVIKWCQQATGDIDLSLTAKDHNRNVVLLRNPSGEHYVVVALDGTVIKWETSLRNALEFMVGKPFAQKHDVRINMVLSLFARNAPVGPTKKQMLIEALRRIGAYCYIWGES